MSKALDNLKANLVADLQSIIPPGRKVVFFDYAVFRNVGDLLISRSVEHFFELNGNKVVDRFCMQNHKAALDRTFASDVIFVFQGGGNFGDLFEGHQSVRVAILLAHPQQTSVVLPQTMYYQNNLNMQRDAEKLSALKNLTLCLRDSLSFDIAKKHFSNDLRLLPDTAHLLQDVFGVQDPGIEPLNFLRLDQSDYSITGLDVLPGDRSTFMDWPRFLTPAEGAAIRRFQQIHTWDARIGHTFLPHAAWRLFRERLLRRAAALFLSSSDVVTNRLHGLIFAIITRRQVSIIESGYGKVSAYYDTFLKDVETVSIRTPDVHCTGGMADMMAASPKA